MPIIFEKSWLRRYDLCALLAYYQLFVCSAVFLSAVDR